MSKLLCVCCKDSYRLTDNDVANGMVERRSLIVSLKKPEKLVVTVTTAAGRHEVDCPKLCCDCCGGDMPDGTSAMAITQWRGLSPEPEKWEQTYELPIRLDHN